MFEEIMLFKIKDPGTGVIYNVFIENAETYNKIMCSAFAETCIVKKDKAYIFRDVPDGWKLYDCPKVYLTKEEKIEFEKMMQEVSDTDPLDKGTFLGTTTPTIFKKKDLRVYLLWLYRKIRSVIFSKQKWFYYGANEVTLSEKEAELFLAEFGINSVSSKPVTRKRTNNHQLV